MTEQEKPDYTNITELPGGKIAKIQLQRYKFASQFCRGKDVLEVACGSGSGLSLLAETARSVIGGDIEEGNLKHARDTYKNHHIEVMQLDAHNLEFEDNSFDVILLFEAIYYLKDPKQFLKESKRVLRTGGKIILCTANKNWSDFNPSPYSYKYFSVPELKEYFESEGFKTDFAASFPDQHDSVSAKIKSLIKRTAVKFNLMPKTMKGKAGLKRLFYGKLVDYPKKLSSGITDYVEPNKINSDEIDQIHTAIFAVAEKGNISRDV